MTVEKQAVQFLMEGYTVVPAALSCQELVRIREAFDRAWSVHSARGNLAWDICGEIPELLNLIGHPALMPLVEAILAIYEDTPVFTHMATRLTAVSDRKLGTHHDGMPTFRYDFAQRVIATLWYFDPMEEDSGSYVAYMGSHHLSRPLPDGKAGHPAKEFVLTHCEARKVVAPAGSVILHRAFNWHDVEPIRRIRRAAYSGYCGRGVYHLQAGHDVVTPAQRGRLPFERRKFLP